MEGLVTVKKMSKADAKEKLWDYLKSWFDKC